LAIAAKCGIKVTLPQSAALSGDESRAALQSAGTRRSLEGQACARRTCTTRGKGASSTAREVW